MADDKRTCLHLAACTGNLQIVEQLIEFGANVNFEDRWGVRQRASKFRANLF